MLFISIYYPQPSVWRRPDQPCICCGQHETG